MNKTSELIEKIVEYGIATREEIKLVTDINGETVETLNEIIFVRTADRNIKQYEETQGL